MVTYADLIQFCLLIVALVGLVQHNLVLYNLQGEKQPPTTCNSERLMKTLFNCWKVNRAALAFPFLT